MRQEYANSVVALVTILVSVGLGSVWNLLLFGLHQSRATTAPRDGLFRQQQVLLRSMGTPGSVALDSIKLAKAWTTLTPKARLRSLPLAVMGLAFAVGCLAAGVFSSATISLTSLKVLVDSPGCQRIDMAAYLSAPPPLTVDLDTEVHNVAVTYADRCYGSWATPSQCDSFVSSRIPIHSSSCRTPFPSRITRDTDLALLLDTGYLDSNDVFGINAKKEDRAQIRRKATCTPLESPSHTSVIDPQLDPQHFISHFGRNPFASEMLIAVHYGAQTAGLAAVYNATDIRSTLTSNITSRYYPV